jgi:hypothetical protein
LVTVKVSDVIDWPGSTVEAVTLLNRSTAAAPSVNVTVAPVATSVGSSLFAVTVMSEVAAVLVPPSPSFTVTLIVRVAVGVFDVFW